MTAPDPAKIAEGLSEAQRRAVISVREPDGRGKWPVRNALANKGLAKTYPWSLTPIGLAVRDHLIGERV